MNFFCFFFKDLKVDFNEVLWLEKQPVLQIEELKTSSGTLHLSAVLTSRYFWGVTWKAQDLRTRKHFGQRFTWVHYIYLWLNWKNTWGKYTFEFLTELEEYLGLIYILQFLTELKEYLKQIYTSVSDWTGGILEVKNILQYLTELWRNTLAAILKFEAQIE